MLRSRAAASRSMGTHLSRCPPFETRALRAPQGEVVGLSTAGFGSVQIYDK